MPTRYVYAGEDFTHLLPLGEGSDGSDVVWTLYDNAGSVVETLSGETISTTAGDATALVTVPAVANTVGFRFLRYTCGAFRGNLLYQVVAWAPLTVSNADARNLLGLSDLELPEDQVDVQAAWLELKEEFTSAEVWLYAADSRAKRMNDAVAHRAAAAAARYLQLRVAQSMASETLSFKRYDKVDFDALARGLEARVQQLLGITEDVAPAVFFTLSSVGTDAITGA